MLIKYCVIWQKSEFKTCGDYCNYSNTRECSLLYIIKWQVHDLYKYAFFEDLINKPTNAHERTKQRKKKLLIYAESE